MPKLKVSKKDRMDNSARELIDMFISRTGLPRTEASKDLFISYPTFHRRYNDPETMTVGELRRMVGLAKPSDEEILRILK